MNPERREELIRIIEKTFPVTAELLRLHPREPLFDCKPRGVKSPGKFNQISYQAERKAKRIACGVCRDCARKLCPQSKQYCKICLVKHRVWNRNSNRHRMGTVESRSCPEVTSCGGYFRYLFNPPPLEYYVSNRRQSCQSIENLE